MHFGYLLLRRKEPVKAAIIDTDALCKMITQDSPIYALALVAFAQTRHTLLEEDLNN